MVAVEVAVGFAAGMRGQGIAYARIHGSAEHLLRVAFRMRPGFGDDEVGYAALTAVARTLRRRGLKNLRLAVDDDAIVAALNGGDVPEAVVIPYVRLKCALNGFDEVRVTVAQAGDLAQRARAEAALLPAA